MKGMLRTLLLGATALAAIAAAPIAGAKEFLIGNHMPLSGYVARMGQEMNNGIYAAVEYYRRHAPQHTFKVVTIDDESQPAKAVAAVEKLAAEGAIAFSAGYGGNVVGAASSAAEKAGIVYMSSGGGGDALMQRGFKRYFRVTNSAAYLRTLTGFLEDRNVKSVSILYSTKESTADLANKLKEQLPRMGVKTTSHAYEASMSDFKPLLNRVKLQDKPEVLLLVGYENDYVSILRAARILKPNLKAIVAPWGLATPQMAKEFGPLFQNVFGGTLVPYPIRYDTAEGKEFLEIFREKYKKDPDYVAQIGFVQTQVLFEAILRANDKNQLTEDGIARELAATDRDTLLGRVRFAPNGDYVDATYRMAQHQDGRIELVWPAKYQTAPIRYPALPW